MPTPGSKHEASSRLWRLSGMGSELAFGVIGMALLGWLLDRWLHSSPWLMLACTAVGIIGGGWNFIRKALAETRASTQQWKDEHPGWQNPTPRKRKRRGGGL